MHDVAKAKRASSWHLGKLGSDLPCFIDRPQFFHRSRIVLMCCHRGRSGALIILTCMVGQCPVERRRNRRRRRNINLLEAVLARGDEGFSSGVISNVEWVSGTVVRPQGRAVWRLHLQTSLVLNSHVSHLYSHSVARKRLQPAQS